MKKEYLYIGLGILLIGGIFWWNKKQKTNNPILYAGNQHFLFLIEQKFGVGYVPKEGDTFDDGTNYYVFTNGDWQKQ